MFGEKEKPYWIKALFWWSLAVSAIITAVTIIVKMENARVEREQDEKDCDIKECGC